MDLLIISLLILTNGIFSMYEIALISARKSSLNSDIGRGNQSARIAMDMINKPESFLSTIQIGITLIGILTGIFSGDKLAGPFSIWLTEIGIPKAYSHTTAMTTIIIVITYLSIIFGELIPKRIGMTLPTQIAKLFAKPMLLLSFIATPFVWLLSKSTSIIFNMLHIDTTGEKVTEEEIKFIIEQGAESGEVQEVEHEIVDRVFSLGSRSISTLMTYRSDVVYIDISMKREEIYNIVCQHLFQVYPVTQDNTLDNIIGVIHLKDLFGKLDSTKRFDIREHIKKAEYFHENSDVYKVLELIKKRHIKYGLICDEFGSMQGMITIKDILEAFVGSLPEEYEEPDIIERNDGSWLIDGQCPFYDFLKYFDMDDIYSRFNYNTLSGLVLHKLSHIPKSGESFEWNHFTFEIVDMDGARIDKILVNKKE